MDNDKTCSTCKYQRTMPLWISALKLEIKHFCCRDKFVSIDPDDSCEHWETHFDTSFNKALNKD